MTSNAHPVPGVKPADDNAGSTHGNTANPGATRLSMRDRVAHITFDRPAARNAMTWTMYEQLAQACDAVAGDKTVRAVVFRGSGGKAFVAGTDIEQFLSFRSGDDGVAYEAQIARFVGRVSGLTVPTVAIVEGWAVGGGMAIANACDFRIATKGARFGVPIARTLGNCLSMGSLSALVTTLGPVMVRRMLLLGEMPLAEELHVSGYVLKVCEPLELEAAVEATLATLTAHAPVTMAVTKTLLARWQQGDRSDEDVIRQCYGSEDFAEGVRAFVAKRPPVWKGC